MRIFDLLSYLVDSVFSLLAIHFRDVDDFHDVGLTVGYRLDLNGVAKTTFTDDFEFAISIHVFSLY